MKKCFVLFCGIVLLLCGSVGAQCVSGGCFLLPPFFASPCACRPVTTVARPCGTKCEKEKTFLITPDDGIPATASSENIPEYDPSEECDKPTENGGEEACGSECICKGGCGCLKDLCTPCEQCGECAEKCGCGVTAPIGPFALRVIALINQQRRCAGLPALIPDPKLSGACHVHSTFMSSHGFQHANGSGMECIAMGVRTPESLVNMWMHSSGHRAILMSRGTIVGVGSFGSFHTLRID